MYCGPGALLPADVCRRRPRRLLPETDCALIWVAAVHQSWQMAGDLVPSSQSAPLLLTRPPREPLCDVLGMADMLQLSHVYYI